MLGSRLRISAHCMGGTVVSGASACGDDGNGSSFMLCVRSVAEVTGVCGGGGQMVDVRSGRRNGSTRRGSELSNVSRRR
jgi:hypothetical protein